MRPIFRQTLEEFQGMAKAETQKNIPYEEREYLADVRNGMLERHSKDSGINAKVYKEVYQHQREKAFILRDLQEDFQRIDKGEGVVDIYPDGLPTRYENGKFIATWNGREVPVTVGQIIADITWGTYYQLDKHSVPKTIQKRYALEIARANVWDHMQDQITLHEGSAKENFMPYSAFQAIVYNERSQERTGGNAGFLAEEMMYSLFKQLEFDTGMRFKAKKADAYHDAVQKIDFLLVVPQESGTAPVVKGFQIALGKSNKYAKNKQIKKVKENEALMHDVDEIEFFVLKRDLVERAYNKWLEAEKPPGGPCGMLTKSEVMKIVVEAAGDILPIPMRMTVRDIVQGLPFMEESTLPHARVPDRVQDLPSKEDDRAVARNPTPKWNRFVADYQAVSKAVGIRVDKDTRLFLSMENFTTGLRDERKLHLDLNNFRVVCHKIKSHPQVKSLRKWFTETQRWADARNEYIEPHLKCIEQLLPFMQKLETASPGERDQYIESVGKDWLGRVREFKIAIEKGDAVLVEPQISQYLDEVAVLIFKERDRIMSFLGNGNVEGLQKANESFIALVVLYRELNRMREYIKNHA